MSAMLEEAYAALSNQMGAATVDDPYPLFAELRRTEPVMEGDLAARFGIPSAAQSSDGSRRVFSLFRYDDVSAVLRDAETFPSDVIAEVFRPVLGRIVLGMNGEEHRMHRGLMMPGFTRSMLEIWREEIMRPVARSLAAELAARPEKRVDLVDYGMRFPIRMIYEVLGFPHDDEEQWYRFAQAGLTILLALTGVNPQDPEGTQQIIARAAAESQDLYGRIRAIIERRRAEGSTGDDLIGRLLRSDFEGRQLTDDELTVFMRALVPPSSETTTRTWLNTMTCLLLRPEVLDEVRADRSLLGMAIDEGTRLESAGTTRGRSVAKDVEIRGVNIPKGSAVTVVSGSANRDENVYENPDEFDLHRAGPPSLSFGFGPHICVGMNTAKLEMIEATDALLGALPGLRIDPDAPPPAIRGLSMRSPTRLDVVWD